MLKLQLASYNAKYFNLSNFEVLYPMEVEP